MKRLNEVQFRKLSDNGGYVVSPYEGGAIPKGVKTVKRSLDGRKYLVDTISGYLSIFTASQLRGGLVNGNETRQKAIKVELKRRGLTG